jgi:hypothetical protein
MPIRPSEDQAHKRYRILYELTFDCALDEDLAKSVYDSGVFDSYSFVDALRHVRALLDAVGQAGMQSLLERDPRNIHRRSDRIKPRVLRLMHDQVSRNQAINMFVACPELCDLTDLDFERKFQRLLEIVPGMMQRHWLFANHPEAFLLPLMHFELKAPITTSTNEKLWERLGQDDATGLPVLFMDGCNAEPSTFLKQRREKRVRGFERFHLLTATSPEPVPLPDPGPARLPEPEPETIPEPTPVPPAEPIAPSKPAPVTLVTKPARHPTRYELRQKLTETLDGLTPDAPCHIEFQDCVKATEPLELDDHATMINFAVDILSVHLDMVRDILVPFVRHRPWLIEKRTLDVITALAKRGFTRDRLWHAVRFRSGILVMGMEKLHHVFTTLASHPKMALPDDLANVCLTRPVLQMRLLALKQLGVPDTDPIFGRALFAHTNSDFRDLLFNHLSP